MLLFFFLSFISSLNHLEKCEARKKIFSFKKARKHFWLKILETHQVWLHRKVIRKDLITFYVAASEK